MRKHLLLSIIFLLTTLATFAQVTSSSMSGAIKDEKNLTLPGASIKATHLPSGTVYTAVTNKDGLFNLPGMRIGGPYTVEVSFIGYAKATYTEIILQLGQPYILNVKMSLTGVQLATVNVTTSKRVASAKSGATTNINRTALATLPTFTRSINDFTRLSPQSNGGGSYGGRDARLNNITVDGASLNNTFGTSSDIFPGGGAQPISIETYDELSINNSPFDVRQSGFTGAGIYATTKSGTNTFHGSAYGYYKNQSFNGTHIGDNDISSAIAKSSTKTYGFTLGGPIIKNKLFFFVNYENEKSTTPGIPYSPAGGSGTGSIASTPIADLKTVHDYLLNNYGYEAGGYDNFPAFQPKNYKFLAKLDWNINSKNKFTVKYSYLNATSDNQINGSSTPNNAFYTFTNTATGVSTTRGSGGLVNNRYSLQSIAFENSNYGFLNVVKTGTAELNSSITSHLSNQLLLTFKAYDNPRTTKGSTFPTIDIYNGQGSNYISAGSDPFTKYNEVIDNTTSLYDNVTYYAGRHTITGGVNYEYQRIGNAFMPGAAGSYIYNSLNDFLTNAAPIQFTYNYSLVPGQDKVYSANLKVGTLSFYAQDEFNVSNNFKLTYGLRADQTIYLQNPIENPQITALQLPDQNGNLTTYNSGRYPNNKLLLSPRAGFRASFLDDNSLVLRGGVGVFTGKIPYVFLTNSPSNSAMYNFGASATAAQLATIKFNPDPSVYKNLFPTAAGTAIQTSTVVLDPKFHFPQVFRANLAVEKNLGNGFNATLEALYTKDINAAKMRNANLKTPTGFTNEPDGATRPRFIGTGTNNAVTAIDRAIYPNLSSVIVLENTNKGYAYQLTAQLSKSFAGGFNATAAYTYTQAKEAFASGGSTAASVWAGTANVGTTNNTELGYTNFYVPHRVVASASYRFNYVDHASTSIGVYYQGQAGSSPYSYTYNGDLNGDGNSSDLMYIPKNTSDVTFAPYTATTGGVAITYTAAQQAAAFDQFINNTPYLSKHRGQFAQRNASFLPWYNRVDANILQDFYIRAGKNGQKHTLEFSATMINVPNFISRYWGIQKALTFSSPLTYTSIAADGTPSFNLRNLNGILVTTPYLDAASGTTWSLLIGAKYLF